MACLYLQREQQTVAVTPEKLSDDVATRNALPIEERNVDEVLWIMGNYVTISSRNQYANKNVQSVMWIFDKGKSLNTRLLAP